MQFADSRWLPVVAAINFHLNAALGWHYDFHSWLLQCRRITSHIHICLYTVHIQHLHVTDEFNFMADAANVLSLRLSGVIVFQQLSKRQQKMNRCPAIFSQPRTIDGFTLYEIENISRSHRNVRYRFTTHWTRCAQMNTFVIEVCGTELKIKWQEWKTRFFFLLPELQKKIATNHKTMFTQVKAS